MFDQKNKSEVILMNSLMNFMRWFSALLVVMALEQSAVQAQTTYPLTSGGYLGAAVARTPETYNAGYTFYSAAWPLMGDYPRDNQVQTGLYGTWMWPAKLVPNSHYTTIEGGLGWWYGRNFQTATPKFIMGGVAWGNDSWWFANGPGSGSTGGNGKYGVAQLSPTLLFPPDGLNLRQGTSGQLLGSGYLALPLTEPKATTAGAAIPTGNHCWTLFMNSGNFKGPAAFYTPYFWSQVMVANPQWAGQGFDSRWAEANKGISMETQETIRCAGYDTAGSTYVRSMPVYYPVDENGYSLMMHRLSVYDQGALWDDVGQWLATSGSAPGGVIDPGSTYVQAATGNYPVWKMKNGKTILGQLNWDGIVSPYASNQQEWGYLWETDQLTVIPSANGSLVKLPEYYQGPSPANSASMWLPIEKENVPKTAAAVLGGANLGNPTSHISVVSVDSDPVWTTPGPSSGPYQSLLGDGSVVTYYWYRFADQPAILKADMTLAERNRIQTVVEKMHREWRNDRDYIAPPTTGRLADLDPGQLVAPPLGLECGYVPIAWRQDWGGSVASPGALKFTAIPATSATGTSFNVTIQATNTTGVVQNVTSATLVKLSVASGYGTLSGNTVGTIPSGSSSVTITGVIYSAADSMTLVAAATCLSSGTSTSITFTNSSGNVNLYNRPATEIAPSLAVLNATLDCLGTNADVHVFWGAFNEGTDSAGWANSAHVGARNGVTSTNLSSTATGLLPDTTYYFTFRGTNASGITWASKVLSFTTLPLAPVITEQPASITQVVGSTANFTVGALRAVSYQWFKGTTLLANGGKVSGADTATLRLNGLVTGDAGNYSVVISNASGQTPSATASLTVVAATTLTWDANGASANVSDGGGVWVSNNWRDGAANVNWANNHNAHIGSGGTGGSINLNEIVVNNLTLSNFSGTYTLSNGSVTVMRDLLFDSSGSAKLSSIIRGDGSLIKNGSGTLTIDGVTPNFYRGGTVVNNGTLIWGATAGSVSPSCDFACGTGPVTLNSGATITLQRAKVNNSLTLNGGTLVSTNGWGAIWAGPVTLNSNTSVQSNAPMNIFGNITGLGGLTKTGSGILTLSGDSTYKGMTVLQTGKMSWLRAASMSSGHLVITNGAVASLDYTGARVIENLTLGGAAMAVGTYGSTASAATFTNNTYFSGPGIVNVVGSNIAPVAEGQSVNTEKNTAAAITLTGTDVNENPLSFAIVTPPTNGVLSGIGRNLIYTPTSNFVGSDSFTFKSNDGLLDSASATVSIIVTPPSYTWHSAVSGNWSNATQWLAGNPISTGARYYVLNFNEPGAYTATHDLSANFLLNQLNFGGSILTLAGNSLALVGNDATLPRINQNSASAVMIQNGINLGADTALVGYGNGKVTVSGLVSGIGSLTKSTPGTLHLYGLVPNTYSGGTIVNSGTLQLGAVIGNTSINVINPVGTGTVTLNGASTLSLERVTASNALIVNGGTLHSLNGWGATWSGPLTLNATLTCNTNSSLTCSSNIGGTGGVTKTNNGRLILSGASSYNGTTTVTAGTLQLNSANTGNNASTITIASSGATLNLNFAGTDTVSKLFIGTTEMTAGIYGPGNIVIPQITGTGTLTVVNSVPDNTPPTLTGSSFVDDKSGGPTIANTLITYTLTFSEDMDASSVAADDFGNAGSAAVTIGTITETAPGIFTVQVTPTSSGTLQMRVNTAAALTDVAGNALATTTAITDDTSIIVRPVNNPPVATDQSLSTATNIAMLITLAATDVNGDTLTYVIATPPVNGILTGTPPNMIYTPRTNYSGADSFTFEANDGAINSAAATVSLTVTPLSLTWANAVAGNWSDATKWTDGSGPSNTGLAGYPLNFNVVGTYTATHDLDAGFPFTQLNFGGSSVTLAGNSLAPVVNGSALPQVNQNSANAVIVSTNLALAANTILGGSGPGELTLSGIISGGGSLTKTSIGNLTLSGPNTYSAGTTVNSGTLTLAHRNGLGSGVVTMAAGTSFQQSTFEGNSSSGGVPNALVLGGTGNVLINMPFSQKDVWLSQPISGSGGLTVQGGSRSLTLTANNTFSGGVKLTNADNRIQISHLNALGTGMFRSERTSSSSGQLIPLSDLSGGAGVPNAVDIAAGSYLNVFANTTNHLLLSGPITSVVGTGHLHKSGTATLTLSGVNTYTGTTTVAAGVIACNSATALGQGLVAITSGAKLTLNYTGTRQVTSLSLGGVAQANGSYGSTTSLATNKNDTYFTGTGSVTVGPITTNTIVASSLNPATVGTTLTFTATVSGGSPTGNVSFYHGATLLGSSALNGLFQASVTSSSLAAGAYSITASYAGNSSHANSVSTALSQVISLLGYQTWASSGTQGLTAGVNDTPLADPDGDGIANLMEFVLGGTPMLSSQNILPKLAKSSENWLFQYNRSDLSVSPAITQVVEYGSDLTGWTRVIIPATSANIVTITPGSPSDRVTVTIPNLGNQLFVRLKVSQ